MNISSEYKDKIAIVVVGYNRLDSIKRLLYSLLKAKYPSKDIPLCISIDASGCIELNDYVNAFEWPHGEKFVNIQQERLGLRKHIIQCGDLSQKFKGVIILEDDIYVSEYFYQYVLDIVEYYYDDDRIAGFSLYKNEVCGPYNFEMLSLNDGSDSFLRQSVASWGQCWTDKQWAGFRKWYDGWTDEKMTNVDMPLVIKKWTKAWSKFYMAYEILNDKYFIFPNVSLTTCFSEAGENSEVASCVGQANLLCGPKTYHFKPFEELVKYDIFSCNLQLYDWVSIPEKDLCLSINGNNPNIHHKRYVLSTYEMPYQVVRSWALQMRPIELNVRDNLQGTGIYLYDSTQPMSRKCGKYPPINLIRYNLREFFYRVLVKYLWWYFKDAAKRKVKKVFK